MNGWIKLHRQLLEWEWYDEPDTFRLFMHCLLKANHKDNNYRGQIVKAGSFLTSRDLLSKETGLSVQKIRTSLERLELTKEITTKKSKKGTVLQIVKYKNYQGDNQVDNHQSNQQSNQQLTNNQPTANQQLTTNNNDNNEENEKNNKEIVFEMSLDKIDNKVNKIINRFKETNYDNNIRLYKTSKEELTNHLKRFLEIRKDSDEFKNKPYNNIITWFWNWCNSKHKPKEVVIKSSTPAPWLQKPKN
jgi:hypothetical protein